jgi:hypothetical protein
VVVRRCINGATGNVRRSIKALRGGTYPAVEEEAEPLQAILEPMEDISMLNCV